MTFNQAAVRCGTIMVLGSVPRLASHVKTGRLGAGMVAHATYNVIVTVATCSSRSTSRVRLDASGLRGGFSELRGRPRSFDDNNTLRSRTFFGVTSTHSSSVMNSSACSSDITRGGTSRTRSSEPDAAVVRELLFLRRVHVHLVGACVLADDHALVDLDAGTDEHRAALLQVHQRVRGGHAAAVGDQAARSGACAARRTTAPSRRTRGAACRCRASRS